MRQVLRWWHTHIQRNNNMKDVKVITPEDLGDGIVWNDQTQKYEAVSQVFFTEREATVDLMINGMQLLFREVANSNRTMVVTGVNYNNVWYGDAPDNEQATNPFTGQPISAPEPLSNVFLRQDDLTNYVIKGENGSWSDTIPVATNLQQPQRIVKYEPTTANRPPNSNYGVAVSWSSKGTFAKEAGNWVPTLAFDTMQRLYHTQSINGTNDVWVCIPTATFSEHTVKFSSTMPSAGAAMVLSVPTGVVVHRNKLTNLRMRVDLTSSSIMFQGKLEAVIDSSSNITGIKFVNDSSFNIPSGRPLTIFMSYER